MTALLDIQDISIEFCSRTMGRTNKVVSQLSFQLNENEVLGVVGESGSGKSQLMLALLGLSPVNASIAGTALYNGQDLFAITSQQQASVRCNDIAMVFQDPMSALNPYLTIGTQLTEASLVLQKRSRREVFDEALQLLTQVQIPNPQRCLQSYPHELSGGMRQRVMIAMALIRKPRILIADEPTTALDVTVQAEILSLLKQLQQRYRLSIILITHDMSIVAGQCDRVMVMYAGQLVEVTTTEQLFADARHPYTQGLLKAARSQSGLSESLYSIPGYPPKAVEQIQGCVFCERCERRLDICWQQTPVLSDQSDHQVACHLYAEYES